MSATIRRSLARAAILVGVLIASFSLLTPPSGAMSLQGRDRLLHIAASRQGDPYQYGAEGPHRFDCSGYTKWVFARMGRYLPRTASQQSGAVRHVRRADRRRGDLVFFHSGGHVYHVGIYAGHGYIWHSPRPGQRVHREHLWTSSVSYGRVR
jgi:cell wall-associated NlpC family hydrolase